MDFTKSADGTRIALYPGGNGPTLIVVNGALSDHASTDMLRHWLEPHFNLVGYDRRGRTNSRDTRPYALEREIEDLAAVIHATGKEAMVFGHSAGAVLALEAAMHGLPITRLAVNEPPYILPGTRPMPPAQLNGQIALLAQIDDREAIVDLFLRDEVGLSAAEVRQIQAQPTWRSMVALAPSVRYDLLMLGRHELPASRLAGIHIPTMVLSGGASYGWIVASAKATSEFIPRAEYRVLPDQPHTPAPHVLCPELVRFFGS